MLQTPGTVNVPERLTDKVLHLCVFAVFFQTNYVIFIHFFCSYILNATVKKFVYLSVATSVKDG